MRRMLVTVVSLVLTTLCFCTQPFAAEQFDRNQNLPHARYKGYTISLPHPDQISRINLVEAGRHRQFLTMPAPLYSAITGWGLNSEVLERRNNLYVEDSAVKLISFEDPLITFQIFVEPSLCPDLSWHNHQPVVVEGVGKTDQWEVVLMNEEIFHLFPFRIGSEADFRSYRFFEEKEFDDRTSYFFNEIDAAFKKETSLGHTVVLGKVNYPLSYFENRIRTALLTEDPEGEMFCDSDDGGKLKQKRYRVVWRASQFTRDTSPFTPVE